MCKYARRQKNRVSSAVASTSKSLSLFGKTEHWIFYVHSVAVALSTKSRKRCKWRVKCFKFIYVRIWCRFVYTICVLKRSVRHFRFAIFEQFRQTPLYSAHSEFRLVLTTQRYVGYVLNCHVSEIIHSTESDECVGGITVSCTCRLSSCCRRRQFIFMRLFAQVIDTLTRTHTHRHSTPIEVCNSRQTVAPKWYFLISLTISECESSNLSLSLPLLLLTSPSTESVRFFARKLCETQKCQSLWLKCAELISWFQHVPGGCRHPILIEF